MKNNHKIKLIAASLALTTSFSAVGGLGGLNVQSNLGEPFSGTVTVTGEEARLLLNGGNASLSNGNLRANVRKSGNNAVINIRSSTPVNDPVLVFQVGVGSQSRQYTAIIDPADYPTENGNSGSMQPESSTPTIAVQTEETSARAETQQPSSAKGKLKAKKPQEQVGKEQKNTTATRDKLREQAITERRSETPRSNYKVSRGETLTSIANQIRPSGLSVHETIAAIMTANPEIFPTRNANQILAGKVLNIPSSEELKRLAKQPVPSPQEQTTRASQPDTAISTSTEAIVAASAAASDAAMDTTTTAASTPTQASEPEAATANNTASKPATSSSLVTTQPVQPVSEEEKSSDLWRWLLFAGLGAIALWLLLKLAGKKKTAVKNATGDSEGIIIRDDSTDSDSDDEYETHTHAPKAEIRTHQPITYPSSEAKSSASAITPTATVAAIATDGTTKTEDDDLNVEDDFDDIFFSEAQTAPVEKTEGNFNLDLGSIDHEQSGIVSGALTQDKETQQREHADWDNIESTESVYEPEAESEFQHIAVEFNANEDTVTNQEVAVTTKPEPTDSAKKTAENGSLNFYTTQSSHDDVIDQIVSGDEEQIDEPPLSRTEITVAPESAKETIEIDTLSLTNNESDTVTATFTTEVVTEQSFLATDVTQSAKPETAEDSLASSISAIAAGSVEEAVEIEADRTAVISQDNDFAFQDNEDVNSSVNLSTDKNAETIEWESINIEDSSRSDDGFISESVGMTAPLEAKYELAQMYVEIGDPDAARETLQELLEESSGKILEKAKAMLTELDK